MYIGHDNPFKSDTNSPQICSSIGSVTCVATLKCSFMCVNDRQHESKRCKLRAQITKQFDIFHMGMASQSKLAFPIDGFENTRTVKHCQRCTLWRQERMDEARKPWDLASSETIIATARVTATSSRASLSLCTNLSLAQSSREILPARWNLSKSPPCPTPRTLRAASRRPRQRARSSFWAIDYFKK